MTQRQEILKTILCQNTYETIRTLELANERLLDSDEIKNLIKYFNLSNKSKL